MGGEHGQLAVVCGDGRGECVRFSVPFGSAIMVRMNNLKLKILERAYADPGLTVGGLADCISRGPKTEQEVQYLVDKGYLLNDNGLGLSNKGFARIDSASFRNRAMRVGKCVLRTGLSVVAVLIGNWLWHLMQSSL